jgi:hypothetical protein
MHCHVKYFEQLLDTPICPCICCHILENKQLIYFFRSPIDEINHYCVGLQSL